MAEKEKPKPKPSPAEFSRIDIAYHGKRTDARDRTSEDPIHHTLPRASLAVAAAVAAAGDDTNSEDTNSEKSKSSTLKKRSFRSKRSKSREKERRASRERELAKTRKSPPPLPPGMPTSVEMNFEVLRPAHPVAAEKSAENSPAAKKRSLNFQFWRDQQLKKSEAKQAQMEGRKPSESQIKVTSLPKKSPKPESVVVETGSPKSDKKFGRSSSLSTFFNAAFSRKKSSSAKTEPRKFSADVLVQSSPLNPEFHASIVHGSEDVQNSFSPIPEDPDAISVQSPEPVPPVPEVKSPVNPLQAWRLYRQKDRQEFREIPPTVPEMSNENSEADPISLHIVRAANEVSRPPDPEIPTPDYDQMSVASSNASSFMSARYFQNRATDSSMEELRPHLYYSRSAATATPPMRSTSQFSIPRFAIKHRTRSLLSASPRLEHRSSRSPSTDSIIGSRLGAASSFGSSESQIWYQNYQHDAFPHEAVFGDEDFKGHSVDGRMHHIKGELWTGRGLRIIKTLFLRSQLLSSLSLSRYSKRASIVFNANVWSL